MVTDSGSHGPRVGYIRVSTVEKNNQRQKELLNASGRIDRFFEDRISGRTKTARCPCEPESLTISLRSAKV